MITHFSTFPMLKTNFAEQAENPDDLNFKIIAIRVV